ncbi:MAG: hypothetical protein MJZ12_10425, partial [Prevotella sp.]|nr:hypothetical protein [Prevotella sp.]
QRPIYLLFNVGKLISGLDKLYAFRPVKPSAISGSIKWPDDTVAIGLVCKKNTVVALKKL